MKKKLLIFSALIVASIATIKADNTETKDTEATQATMRYTTSCGISTCGPGFDYFDTLADWASFVVDLNMIYCGLKGTVSHDSGGPLPVAPGY